MLSFDQLTFRINQKSVFNKINITFLPSAIVYVQGPNGSGKTSLLRMAAGVQRPTSGNIYYQFSPCTELIKPYCNYIGHNLGIKLAFSVFDNLKFWGEVYDSLEAIESAIYYFKLQNILDEKCYTLSAGNLKKVAISRLIVCKANLWLLDEVESNLDQENKDLLHNLIISKANNGGIILMASHSVLTIQSAQILNLMEYV